ncbi:Centrosomal protein of 55 kDa [Saguinus oedipus]|uniref:Centrosomal protein of 55 kDa n=1 Tax=Saguinus oedipus TaxID=9490 RepID=A0ABQ9VZ22_SAGOE|nr:Centrosomal protein of 55 kDa [Saguinus oedipus]
MSSRSTKYLIKSKWGSKPSNSKSETALEKFKGEIADLKTLVVEITSGKGKLTEKERHRLLEKIRVLEAEKKKNAYQFTEKDKEIQLLTDQLKATYSTTKLPEQLEKKTRSKTSVLHLSQTVPANGFNSSICNIHEMEIQLKDALEKNQQWLVYDQQREVYVRELLAKILELENKAETAPHSHPQQTKKPESEDYLQEEKQKHYKDLLASTKKDLEVEQQTVTQLNFELSEFRRKYEETQKEVQDLNHLLYSQRKADVQHLEDDRHKTEKIQRLREENDIAR